MASSLQRCLFSFRATQPATVFQRSGIGSRRSVAHFSDWKMPDGHEEEDMGTMFKTRNPRNFTKDGIALPKGWVEVPELTCFKTGKLLRRQYFYHESTQISQWDFPKGSPTRDQLLQQRAREKADKVHLVERRTHVPGSEHGPAMKPKKWTLGKSLLISMVAVPFAVFCSHHFNRWRIQQDNIFSDWTSLVNEWMMQASSKSGELAVLLKDNLQLVKEYAAKIEAKIAEASNDESRIIDGERSRERSRRLKNL